MFGSFYVKKFCAAVLAASVLLTCFPTPLFAATGSVRIVITRTNFIFGGGSGTYTFKESVTSCASAA